MSYFLRIFQNKRIVLAPRIRTLCIESSKQCNTTSEDNKSYSYCAMYRELFERCPENQKKNLIKLDAKHKSYVTKVQSLPNELPKIDWNDYKTNVREDKINMVKEFEERYKNIEIPKVNMPQDIENQLEEETRLTKEALEKYLKTSNENIKKYEERIKYLQSMVPYEQMTIEEYFVAHPENALDPINKPIFWPHYTEDSELGNQKNVNLEKEKKKHLKIKND